MEAIQVLSVETRGDDVIVKFTDGHIAGFTPYSHGFGYQVEGLRSFRLYHAGETVCNYDARLYWSGPQEDEHKLKLLAEGYTQERAASYWKAARDYLHKEYFQKPDSKKLSRLWYPWKLVCCEGGFDVERLAEGKVQFFIEQK